MYTYLLLNILTVLVPFLFSFEKKIAYAAKWKALFPAMALTAAFFLAWDHYFTAAGVWGFTESYLVNIYAGHLPLEEILFFFCIPYSCVFIYEALSVSAKSRASRPWAPFLALLAVLLVACAVANTGRIYTLTVCLITAAFLLAHVVFLKFRPMGIFHAAFGISLVPFLIVNGILTRGIRAISAAPVVWYDPAAILNLRIGTVPLEDFLYSYLLIFMNVTWYEFFKRKFL
ncbi:MAG TPA: lycopene cyclase domain-containing protein [Candidatus Omnitrophota bacterium]|nr:lycopene cyclase domain-containing protein [Candidatus Omnitrophota bacterium]